MNRILIQTKLVHPPSRDDLVERPRLLARLDEAIEHRVTLISAPPGFGKTTLAAQWLDRQKTPVAWLALDLLDSEPERFARYLVAAVEGATSRRLREAAALLAAREAPPSDYLCEVLVSELARGEKPLFLVLEDFHAVESEDVQRFVERLVHAMPAALHVLVLTRRDPPWPLSNWRAQGWLLELRARDLRFSLEETRRFFEAGRPVPLSDPTVERLHRRTEGWVASLRLAKISLRHSAQPEERAREFSGNDRLVVDYLIQEVLAAQPPEIRTFLAATAPLSRFCAELCDHLIAERAPQPAAREILARLLHENLFLVPLDAEGRWYRYHHLFQDLLLKRPRDDSWPERLPDLDRRAAEWFSREGLIEEALRHWIRAGELDAAADLVGQHLRTVIDEDLSRRVLSRWLGMFPQGAEHGRLPLLIAHGYMRIMRWDVAGLAGLIAEAEPLLSRSGLEPREEGGTGLRGDLDAQKTFRLYWAGDAGGALRTASRALDNLPRSGNIGRSLAIVYKAGALGLQGRKDAGLRILDEAIADAGVTERRRMGEFLFAQGALHLYAAEMGSADLLGRRMLAAHEVGPLADYWLGYAHYLRAVAAYEQNELDEADAGFDRVTGLRYRVNSRLYQDALIGRCLVARARAQTERVARYAAEARAYALEVSDPTSLRVADSFEARLALVSGERLPPSFAPPAAPDFMFFWLEVPSLTYAETLIHDGSAEALGKALPFIERALEQVDAHHNVRQSLAFSLVRAEALAGRGEQEAALAAVAETLRRAEPHGLKRTFLDRGPALTGLLAELAKRRGRQGYLGTLLSALEPMAKVQAGRSDARSLETWMILSNREMDVLGLLAERLTNKEIAARLHVSPETVKRHTQSIFQKLDVHGRRQAVAQATARGLLSPRS